MIIQLIHSERGFANEIRRYKVVGISATTKEKLLEFPEIVEVVNGGYIGDVEIKSDHLVIKVIDSNHDFKNLDI
ncbi:hypothetical protein ACFQ21_00830 [Ohtaekwangia kribbensis]|jgi:hypothetical protein|uniref:Uncharacterized protein n=1 Tax=Ohtaekwangia kribbensis TaxID=688913 RepID=A0ABW3JW64_9BACT